MPSVKAKITVRDLGKSGRKSLEKTALKKARGGALRRVTVRTAAKAEGCDYKGDHCDMLDVSVLARPATLLTVLVDGTPK